MITEISVICVGDVRYRFSYDTIQYYDFDYNDRVMRIENKNGSFIEFQKSNIICVEVNKDKAIAEDIEKTETRAYFDGQAYGWEEGRKDLCDKISAEIKQLPIVLLAGYDHISRDCAIQIIDKSRSEV